MEEEELLKKAKNGDRKSLEILLKDGYPIVFGYVMKLSRNEEMAKDITQEVMVKAIINVKNFRGKSKFSTWLISIAINIYRDDNRKSRFLVQEKTAKRNPEGFQNEDKINSDRNHNNYSESAEETSIKNSTKATIMGVVDSLPEAQREAFLLKYFYDMSYVEISKATRCPIGTVRSRLHNGIKKIKETIVKEELL